MVFPGFSPLRRQAQHQFEIFAATEAPTIPGVLAGPSLCAGEGISVQNRPTATASTKTIHCGKKPVAAVGPTGSPGKLLRFAGQQGLKGIKPGPWPLVASNRLLFQRGWKRECAGECRVLQECQSKSAQPMGAAAHQQITRLGLCPMQSQRSESCKGTDREQSLLAGAAVTSQQSPAKAFEGF